MRVLQSLLGHLLVKADVGLDQVDNTSDANKPVSTAQAAAIGLKADASALTAHTGNVSNPHAVTKAQVGLGSVDNTSDAGKPVSTAQAASIATKADDAATTSALAGKQPLDSDLTAFAAIAPAADGSFLGRSGGAYAMRSAANTKVDLSLDKVLNIKDNYSSAVPPTVSNDSSQGYSVGSRWVDTLTHIAYYCASASVGAALWVKLNFISSVSAPLVESGGGLTLPAAAGPSTNGYMLGSDKARLDALYAPVLLVETLVGAGGLSSVTFSSIPQTYRDLLLTWSAQANTGVPVLGVSYNGDFLGNYDWQRLTGIAASSTAGEVFGDAKARIGSLTAVAGYFSTGEARIFEYTRTDRVKISQSSAARVAGSTTGLIIVEHDTGVWRTTNAAITSLTVFPDAGNFTQNSIVRLFGLP
jgi:hypothetical protein